MTWNKDYLFSFNLYPALQPPMEDCCIFIQLLHHAIHAMHGCTSCCLPVACVGFILQPYISATNSCCACAVHAQNKQCWRNEYQERWSQGCVAKQQAIGSTAYRGGVAANLNAQFVSKLAADTTCQRQGRQVM